MNIIIYLYILTGIYFVFKLYKERASIENPSIGSLSEKEKSSNLLDEKITILKTQIAQYKTQQSISFRLLVLSLLIFISISSIILFKIVLPEVINLNELEKAVGIIGGLSLSITFYQLYTTASKRYDEKVEFLAKLKP